MAKVVHFVVCLLIYLERVKEGERKGEKHQSGASHSRTNREVTHNPGMCPDWN